MRKYRGKPIDPTHAGEDGFVYGWYIEQYFTPNSNRYFIFPNNREGKFLDQFIEVKKDTVGQDTGLKGKDFWEGDILESQDGLRQFEIRWNDKAGRWYLHGLGKAWCVNDPIWDFYKKVGTIHDKEEANG